MNLLGFIETRDIRLMKRCNRWLAPRWIRRWMIASTRCGDGWLWGAIGLALLAFGGPERFRATGAALLATAVGVWSFVILKKLTGRRRPCMTESHAWATLLPPDQFSFPSGHTMTAFAVSTPLAGFYPELSLGLAFCAISIACSRILLGMHFLSDVIAGAVLGGAIGYASLTLFTT